MKRKKLTALAAGLLLGATLLVGCGEEEPVDPTGGETTAAVQEQTLPSEGDTTKPSPLETTPEPTEAEPEDTASTKPTETEPEDTASTEPTETKPEDTASTKPTETEPEEPTATEPPETEPEEPTATELPETEPEEPTATEPPETVPEEPTATEPPETGPEEPTATEPSETQPKPTTPRQDVCTLETPYGELHFHIQWTPYMQIQQEQEGDTVRVYFLARLNEKDYPLFDLTISAEPGGEGQPQLTDYEGTKHAVEVNMEESMEYPELDSTGQEILYSMQEQVNFVIENLS